MAHSLSYAEDLRLNYDPMHPQTRFLPALSARAQASSSERLPQAVPWPATLTPKPQPIAPAPAETDDLSRFAGYDAILMTYTAAEAEALATMFTPGYPLSSWYEYRHNIDEYIPLVTGKDAPFNSTEPSDARYYHSLGLYFPCTVGRAKVLLVKSGLHLDHDLETVSADAVIPFNKLVTEMMQTVKPKVFITTGTGGGIGADVSLGDVVIAGQTLFDCRYQFKQQLWAHASYKTTAVSAHALALMTPSLLKVNAAKISAAAPIPGRAEPQIWSGTTATIVTTDKFAFDTSNNLPYKLQSLGQACDMGDAMVGQVLQGFATTDWYAIRNASDPQIPVPPNPPYTTTEDESNRIYADYGAITSAASVIASWAVIASTFGV